MLSKAIRGCDGGQRMVPSPSHLHVGSLTLSSACSRLSNADSSCDDDVVFRMHEAVIWLYLCFKLRCNWSRIAAVGQNSCLVAWPFTSLFLSCQWKYMQARAAPWQRSHDSCAAALFCGPPEGPTGQSPPPTPCPKPPAQPMEWERLPQSPGWHS